MDDSQPYEAEHAHANPLRLNIQQVGADGSSHDEDNVAGNVESERHSSRSLCRKGSSVREDTL